MPTKCLSLVKGRRIRLTRLDGCGRPVYGDCSTAVSKGFISVAFTANTTESDEINVTNAARGLRVRARRDDPHRLCRGDRLL